MKEVCLTVVSVAGATEQGTSNPQGFWSAYEVTRLSDTLRKEKRQWMYIEYRKFHVNMIKNYFNCEDGLTGAGCS